jgi:hypothetical protein
VNQTKAFEPVKRRPLTIDPQQWAEWNIDISRNLTRSRCNGQLAAALRSVGEDESEARLVSEPALSNLNRRVNRVIGRLQASGDQEHAAQLMRALALFEVES